MQSFRGPTPEGPQGPESGGAEVLYITSTDVSAYSDTAYSDTPLTVTLWAGPKSLINRTYGYSDKNICLE